MDVFSDISVVSAFMAQRVWHRYRLQSRLDTFRAHPYPQSVRMKFRDARHKLDSVQEHRVFEGLRDYFVICAQACGRFISMPSQVADDAWHAFILHTRYCQDSCDKACGRFQHQAPAEAMRTQTLATKGFRAPGGLPVLSNGSIPNSRTVCRGCYRWMAR